MEQRDTKGTPASERGASSFDYMFFVVGVVLYGVFLVALLAVTLAMAGILPSP